MTKSGDCDGNNHVTIQRTDDLLREQSTFLPQFGNLIPSKMHLTRKAQDIYDRKCLVTEKQAIITALLNVWGEIFLNAFISGSKLVCCFETYLQAPLLLKSTETCSSCPKQGQACKHDPMQADVNSCRIAAASTLSSRNALTLARVSAICSAIMDCVGCEKCRLWGKLQILGLATSLKIIVAEGSGKQVRVVPGLCNVNRF
jgi:hypothetical protein